MHSSGRTTRFFLQVELPQSPTVHTHTLEDLFCFVLVAYAFEFIHRCLVWGPFHDKHKINCIDFRYKSHALFYSNSCIHLDSFNLNCLDYIWRPYLNLSINHQAWWFKLAYTCNQAFHRLKQEDFCKLKAHLE